MTRPSADEIYLDFREEQECRVPDGGRSLLIANKANHTVELGNITALGMTGPAEMRQVNARGNVDGAAAPQVLSVPGYSVTLLTSSR